MTQTLDRTATTATQAAPASDIYQDPCRLRAWLRDKWFMYRWNRAIPAEEVYQKLGLRNDYTPEKLPAIWEKVE